MLMCGTVASSTPPGFRIRHSSDTAWSTSKIKCSTCVQTMQSKVPVGISFGFVRSATMVAAGWRVVQVEDVQLRDRCRRRIGDV